MTRVDGNKILLDGKQMIFDQKIIEAADYNGKVVVVFDSDVDEGYDNVFCYTDDLKLVWKIRPIPASFGGTARSSYVGVDIKDDKCRVIDFYGRRFVVNIENGEIISKDIVK